MVQCILAEDIERWQEKDGREDERIKVGGVSKGKGTVRVTGTGVVGESRLIVENEGEGVEANAVQADEPVKGVEKLGGERLTAGEGLLGYTVTITGDSLKKEKLHFLGYKKAKETAVFLF